MASKMDSKDVGSMALIPQFYAGREVFITGATGFIGRLLVERLLSTCPDIRRLHLLVRIKRGEPPETRLDNFKECSVFEVLRKNNPDQLKKLNLIPGDIMKFDLGLTDKAIADLHDVSVVFHVAASVNMNMQLEAAVRINTTATMTLLDTCDRLPRMAAFIHVSTGYCPAERALIEETVYPLPRPLPLMLQESLHSKQMTHAQVNRYISPKPNTYTFTKTLAEAAVKEHGCRGYPVAIFRPTTVTTSYRDPYPGWVHGFNGPMGVSAAGAIGLMRVMASHNDIRADILPVDICVNTLIAAAWETAVDNVSEVRVYNCSTGENPTTWGDVHEGVLQETRENPSLDIVWYPSVIRLGNKYALKAAEIFLEIIPLYVAEILLRIFSKNKKRPNLITISQRLMSVRSSVHHFTTNEFWFTTNNIRRLRERLSPADAAIYNIDPTSICWKEYYKIYTRGIGRHLTREKGKGTPAAKKRLQKLLYVHVGVTLLLLLLPAWLVKRHLGAMSIQLATYL